MKKALPAPRLLLGLALVGLAVAYYDAYILYNGQQLWCPPPINGCNEVASSPYARIFNLPVGYFGVVYYLYMLCLAALLAYDPFSRGLRLAALIYSAIGVGFSIYFSYLQVTFIHAFCIYCLVSAITTLLLFIAAISHLGRHALWNSCAERMSAIGTKRTPGALRCRYRRNSGHW
jgi:uncharacterized membrane protein